MATIQDRPFAKSYSGLVNQSVIAGAVITICITAFEIMKRVRRGRGKGKDATKDGIESVETWQFGYLYQGRSWAKNPSPPSDSRWPVYSWVRQTLSISEAQFLAYRGLDATIYIRFLKGCVLWLMLQTATTMPILLPIHILFSQPGVARTSLLRASISSLSSTNGQRFLAFHVILSYWIFISWTGMLMWLAKGLFKYRADLINSLRVPRSQNGNSGEEPPENRGLKFRTVMITNLPPGLRDETELRKYFEHYMSVALPDPVGHGVLPDILTFALNLVRRKGLEAGNREADEEQVRNLPQIERVYIVRKMTELQSLLHRREEVLKKLELAHISLAKETLVAVKAEMDRIDRCEEVAQRAVSDDDKKQSETERNSHMPKMLEVLGPFVREFGVKPPLSLRRLKRRLTSLFTRSEKNVQPTSSKEKAPDGTIWEALHSLPREALDPYQPQVSLSSIFSRRKVPAITYYTLKLGLLTKLVEEHRSQEPTSFPAASTGFVTFANPYDAAKACRSLAKHPNNPLACITIPAPEYEDLDWSRLMKSTYTTEFVRDWVVSFGVWVFTCLWIIPVSLFVSLVSIQNIAAFIPALKTYLDRHPFVENLISSFLPTLLVSILAILIPLLLLLIAKKANTILTFSGLHDRIMIRYHKFLVCNLLVFFCVGTAAVESILLAFKNKVDVVQLIAQSYPVAGPFYIGWLIFTMGIHAGLEIGLVGLPLIVYPATNRTPLPRKRSAGIRPRTLNFYYWLPNHVFVVFISLVFAVLNPLITPFALIYFAIEAVVIKNQLIHVYAKPYEQNGQKILIRISRYTMDGLVLAQVVLLAFMVLNKKVAPAVFIGLLIVITAVTKLYLTRYFRTKFAEDDMLEAEVVCGLVDVVEVQQVEGFTEESQDSSLDSTSRLRQLMHRFASHRLHFWNWKVPSGASYLQSSVRGNGSEQEQRPPVPFGNQRSSTASFRRLESTSGTDSPEQAQTLPPTPARKDSAAPPLASTGKDWTGVGGPAAPPVNAEFEQRDVDQLVSPHGPHPTWDDSLRVDIPYDNPYYSRTFENFLWLPRDPFGLLDLDDTVDLHLSLTSDPATGQLGKWAGQESTMQEQQQVIVAESFLQDSPRTDAASAHFPSSIHESIVPPTDHSPGVEVESAPEDTEATEYGFSQQSRKSSSTGGRRRSSVGLRPTPSRLNSHISLRLPSTHASSDHRLPVRSATAPVPSHETAIDITSGTSESGLGNSVSQPTGLDPRPAMAPSAFSLSRSLLAPSLNRTRSRGLDMIQEASRGSSRPPSVNLHEAVMTDVWAEEQRAAQERMRREEQEESQRLTKSPLTSWIWRKEDKPS
ncbi:DUF221-domain-containing protein [Sistotremastrum suecicum HHB10207 ss-3]|uniref:DUF221-domain-containing protein n=1 Tax=Sistotremastrum suecicum HHB10207 ss-3 TaxID=1314776 RepID=A0A166GPG1_9AGAM|nr:DUF221-domain-containing protein [Sistotremastrum suecicum HHB10207 ss-3]